LQERYRLLDRATTGSASLVLEGEPGIDKTALWRAGIDAALERGLIASRHVRRRPSADLSFSGLGDLLGPHRDADLGRGWAALVVNSKFRYSKRAPAGALPAS
jgi:hypothetical protein